MSDGAGKSESLLADSERIAALGVKQPRDLGEQASQKDNSPSSEDEDEDEDEAVDPGSSTPDPDELLYGEPGFWRYWWKLVSEAQAAGKAPLAMDMVIPDDGEFARRNWIERFDPEIREYVLTGTLVLGRVIVPAATLGSPAEPLLDLALESGFEIRVLSTEARFTIYDRRAVVLSEVGQSEAAGGIEVHRASRSRGILDPIERYFDMLWQLAVPWSDFGGETSRILHLLAQGWTDVRIAEELGISVRTVSRRVSEAMEAHEAASRFELGVKYGRPR